MKTKIKQPLWVRVQRLVVDLSQVKLEVRRYSDGTVISFTGQMFVGARKRLFVIHNAR